MRLHAVLARLGLLAAFVYLFAAAASAGTFNVFGPVTYVRSTASPQTATAAFNALPGSQYTLHVESDSVASAVDLPPISGPVIMTLSPGFVRPATDAL